MPDGECNKIENDIDKRLIPIEIFNSFNIFWDLEKSYLQFDEKI